ncbi:Dihydrofolate reductase [Geodermatophilus amargosae]|uniref:Dihydrofolate reductase n=1 Tax=Geodermatophilus amargosae TaxID=1296565 RepID=A0A1I6YN93_9ACTN|nr:dihydrofolate reductase family protein [Geodermatophilus amargosae]SFT51671.1 Dihydrofolate reductase [Geodermatophilus amargosae]
MTLVIGDITVSLDGFVTGPGADPEHGLGNDGDAIHAWALDSDDPVDRGVLERHAAASGAVVMGRRTFDTVDRGWSDGMGYGAAQDARPPFFVVTSSPPERHRLAATHDSTFVTDGPAAAVERARAAAGDRDVFVMGGGALVGSCLRDGLLDELRLHVAAEVLGGGTPLLAGVGRHRLTQVAVEVSPVCTHLTYRVLR